MAESSSSNIRTGNAVSTKAAPAPLPVFSQAIILKQQGMIFVSGNIGIDPRTNKLVSGIKEQTASIPLYDIFPLWTRLETNLCLSSC